jgi:hypothetical protein
MRATRRRGEDELAGTARRRDPRIAFWFPEQGQAARGGHLDDRRRTVTQDPPLRVDLAEQRIVDPPRAKGPFRRPDEGVDRAFPTVGERYLVELRIG